MTVLPPSRVKSPVCESIFSIARALDRLVEALGAVVGRSRTGRALEHDHLGRRCRRSVSAAHSPAVTPSFLKSRPTQLAYRSSEAVTVRSSRIDRDAGILGLLAARRPSRLRRSAR